MRLFFYLVLSGFCSFSNGLCISFNFHSTRILLVLLWSMLNLKICKDPGL